MSFSRDDAINSIVDLKKQWADANAAGDEQKKNDAAKNAQKIYSKMYSYGYGDVADELQASDYDAAKGVLNKYFKADKSNGTEYLTTLAKGHGLSSADVSNLLKYDSSTRQFTFGGKNIGKADAVIDGVGYWSDTGVLDNVWNDYISKTEVTKPKSTMVNEGNADLIEKYKEAYETAMNENPFETEAGKSVMGKYNLAAIQGRENQLASGAATNGGNIDSFSAANALRQQASLIYQGQEAVLAAQQQKIDNAQKILEGMGVHIDRIYNQDETSKNNEVSRNVAISEVTGYVPNEWTIKNDSFYNTYLNADGTLKAQYKTFDFQSAINKAKEDGNDELAKKYAVVRTAKMNTYPEEYGKYFGEGDVAYLTPQETATVKQANAGRESAERIASGSSQNTLDQIYAEGEVSKDILEKKAGLGLLGEEKKGETNIKDFSSITDADIDKLVVKSSDQPDENGNAYGIDRYGQDLIKLLVNAIRSDSTWGGAVDFKNEDEVNNFIKLVAEKSKEAHASAGQVQKAFTYLGIPLDASKYFETKSDWRDGVNVIASYQS